MDLDELKYQLKNKLSTDHAGRSDEDIASLLNKKTGSIVGKLKKNLWMEILFGILVAIGVRTAWPAIPASTSWGSVAAALGISAVTGVIFGMLPAVRAAKMDPVVALRYE